MTIETSVDARRALLGRLLDHAPLFPPASLSLADALAADRAAGAGPEAWMLARLVWPASRLAELPAEDRGVSVVLDVPLADFLARSREVPSLEAVELRWREGLAQVAGVAAEVYVELPLDASLPTRVDELARLGLRAKVRCGGERVPAAAEVADFVARCHERGVPFKATAGLHHAVRTDGEHGLLNLLAAAVFGDEERALLEEDATAFGLDADAFSWRDRVAHGPELARVRRELFVSVGSCSASEPVDELRALGLL